MSKEETKNENIDTIKEVRTETFTAKPSKQPPATTKEQEKDKNNKWVFVENNTELYSILYCFRIPHII